MCRTKPFRGRYFKGQGNPRGNTTAERTVLAGKDKLTTTTLLSDHRGAVSFEILIIYPLLMVGLFLSLADVAIASFQYISAWEALRTFGQYIQYNNPPDPTAPATWKSGLQTTVAGYTISNLQVMCGSAVCTSGNVTLTPKYFTFSTTITLSPSWVTRRVLCPSSCTYT